MATVVFDPTVVDVRGQTYTFSVGSAALTAINAVGGPAKPQTSTVFSPTLLARGTAPRPESKTIFSPVVNAIAAAPRPQTIVEGDYISYTTRGFAFPSGEVSVSKAEAYGFTTPDVTFLVTVSAAPLPGTKAILTIPLEVNAVTAAPKPTTPSSLFVPFGLRHVTGAQRPQTVIDIFIPPLQIEVHSAASKPQNATVILVPNVVQSSPGIKAPIARIGATLGTKYLTSGVLRGVKPRVRGTIGWMAAVHGRIAAPMGRAAGTLEVKWNVSGRPAAPMARFRATVDVDYDIEILPSKLRAPSPRLRGSLFNVSTSRRRAITIIQ